MASYTGKAKDEPLAHSKIILGKHEFLVSTSRIPTTTTFGDYMVETRAWQLGPKNIKLNLLYVDTKPDCDRVTAIKGHTEACRGIVKGVIKPIKE